jgi:hypothetical protein
MAERDDCSIKGIKHNIFYAVFSLVQPTLVAFAADSALLSFP